MRAPLPARAPAPSPPMRRRVLSGALIGVFVVAGWLVSRTAVDAVAPWEPGPNIASKLAHLREGAGERTVVFVGSSRTHRQFDPHTFDAVMAEAGYASVSYNFGVGGATALETRQMIQQLLEENDEIDLMVVNPELIDPELPDVNASSLRTVSWHDLGNTVYALSAVAESDLPLSEKGSSAYNHLSAFLNNVTGRGQLIASIESPEATADLDVIGHRRDGWVSLDDLLLLGSDGNYRRLNGRLNKQEKTSPAEFAALVEGVRQVAANRDNDVLHDAERRYLEEIVADAEEHGVEVLFIVPPGGAEYRGGWLHAAQQQGVFKALLDYALPEEYPQFFVQDAWFDLGHLDEEASIEWTELVARDIAALMQSGEVRSLPRLERSVRVQDLDLERLAAAGRNLGVIDGSLVGVDAPALVALGDSPIFDEAVSLLLVTGPDSSGQVAIQVLGSDGWGRLGDTIDLPANAEITIPLDQLEPSTTRILFSDQFAITAASVETTATQTTTYETAIPVAHLTRFSNTFEMAGNDLVKPVERAGTVRIPGVGPGSTIEVALGGEQPASLSLQTRTDRWERVVGPVDANPGDTVALEVPDGIREVRLLVAGPAGVVIESFTIVE